MTTPETRATAETPTAPPFPYGPRGLSELSGIVEEAVRAHGADFLNFVMWDDRERAVTFGFRRPDSGAETAVTLVIDPEDTFAAITDGLRRTVDAEFGTHPPGDQAADGFAPEDVTVTVRKTHTLHYRHAPTGVTFRVECHTDDETRCRAQGMRVFRAMVLDYRRRTETR